MRPSVGPTEVGAYCSLLQRAELQPLQVRARQRVVLNVPGVQRLAGSKSSTATSSSATGPMLDAARHDQELALLDPLLPIAKVHPESAPDDQEQLVFVLVVMPDELPLELHQLHVLAVQLADDARD